MTLASALLLLSLVSGQAAPPEPAIAEPVAPQRMAGEMLDPEREARVQRLGKLIRCPMCQALSIADSNSPSARAQLEKVRELVREGRSDEEVLEYFVARYGEFALLEPKKEGLNLAVWIAPLALLLIGVLVIASQVRRRGKAEAALAGAPEEDEYLKAVRAELEK